MQKCGNAFHLSKWHKKVPNLFLASAKILIKEKILRFVEYSMSEKKSFQADFYVAN
jgi:hypothetical protein